jgi:hypothetical protein
MTVVPAWIRVVYIALLVIGIVSGAAFVVRYMTTYRWWASELGRHLVGFTSALTLVLGVSFLSWAWPMLPGRVYIGMSLFTLLIAALVWRWFMFERLRRKDRRDR